MLLLSCMGNNSVKNTDDVSNTSDSLIDKPVDVISRKQKIRSPNSFSMFGELLMLRLLISN